MSPERTWLIVLVISAVAAAASAAMAVLSSDNGNTIHLILSVAAVVIFIACAVMAWEIRSKLAELNKPKEDIECLRLKKPGIEPRQEEDIVPKGKMPKE
jgi:4-amino-4-deoxy-L-arabinose transferase-like glycosyltransferase